MNRNIVKKIIVVVIVILMAITTIGIILCNRMINEPQISHNDLKDDEEFHLDGFLIFIDEYTGDIPLGKIRNKFEEVVTTNLKSTYRKYKDSDESELKNVYKDQKKAILMRYGIDNESDFLAFVNKIVSIDQFEVNNMYKLEIDQESFVDMSDKEGYAYVEANVYDRKDNVLKISAYVSKDASAEKKYIFDIKK